MALTTPIFGRTLYERVVKDIHFAYRFVQWLVNIEDTPKPKHLIGNPDRWDIRSKKKYLRETAAVILRLDPESFKDLAFVNNKFFLLIDDVTERHQWVYDRIVEMTPYDRRDLVRAPLYSWATVRILKKTKSDKIGDNDDIKEIES